MRVKSRGKKVSSAPETGNEVADQMVIGAGESESEQNTVEHNEGDGSPAIEDALITEEASAAEETSTTEESPVIENQAVPVNGGDPSLLVARPIEWSGRMEMIEVSEDIETDDVQQELALKTLELRDLKEKKKSSDSQFNAQIKAVEARCIELAGQTETGYRTVERTFEVHYDWTNGLVQYRYPRVGDQLGAIYDTRPMDPQERQQRLGFEEDRHPDDQDGLPDQVTPNMALCNVCKWEWPIVGDNYAQCAVPDCRSAAVSLYYMPTTPETAISALEELDLPWCPDIGTATAWTQSERDQVTRWGREMMDGLTPEEPAIVTKLREQHESVPSTEPAPEPIRCDRVQHERWGKEPVVVELYADYCLLRFGRSSYYVDLGPAEDITQQRMEDSCVALMDMINALPEADQQDLYRTAWEALGDPPVAGMEDEPKKSRRKGAEKVAQPAPKSRRGRPRKEAQS